MQLDVTVVTDDPMSLQIENLRRSLASNGGKLSVLTSVSELTKFRIYARSTVTVFPSTFEGFGYPPIESLSLGTACVAFDLPVFRETCFDGVTAVQLGDIEAFGKCVGKAMGRNVSVSNLTCLSEDLLKVYSVDNYAFRLQLALETSVLRTTRIKRSRALIALGVLSCLDMPGTWARLCRRGRNTFRSKVKRRLVNIRSKVKRRLVNIRSKVKRRLVNIRRMVRVARQAKPPQTYSVLYYPSFLDSTTLTDHLNRARWYLPGRENRRVSLTYAATKTSVAERHGVEHSPSYPFEQMDISRAESESSLADLAVSADLILVWNAGAMPAALRVASTGSAEVINVDIADYSSVEYGVQAKLRWQVLFSDRERKEILDQSRERLQRLVASIPRERREFCLVMGTGPSFASYRTLSREGGIVIACNSAVSDPGFLQQFRPDFLTFGDAAHHLGPSFQADDFRGAVVRAMHLLPDMHLVLNASYFALLDRILGEYMNRCIWIEQKSIQPVFNLVKDFSLPRLDSVMNQVMLPLASTLSPHVFIVGADGFSSEDGANEDFWAHAESFDYVSQISSSYAAHPTYDVNRRTGTSGNPPTRIRHVESVNLSISEGEMSGIQYRALMSSSIPAFSRRRVSVADEEACTVSGQLLLSALAKRILIPESGREP